MSDPPPFLTDPADTEQAIMAATYRALCAHGYAGLTIQRIAEQFEKSKSLLYHHYDNKDELLVAFLEFMLDQFEAGVPGAEVAGSEGCDADAHDTGCLDPTAHVRSVVDAMLADAVPADHREFVAAMVELRAQAAHDERYRAQFSRHDEFFRERLASVVARGVEAGEFREVDPDRVAAMLVTTIVGTMTRRVTADAPDIGAVRAAVDDYLDAVVLTPKVDA
jgi:AcrR family transcriptional regulator